MRSRLTGEPCHGAGAYRDDGATDANVAIVELPGRRRDEDIQRVAARERCDLSLSPQIVPAALLCSLRAVTVGFGMALAIPDPMITN
jgi:hypothetical protein